MHCKEIIRFEIFKVLKDLEIEYPIESIIVEQPPQITMGDYACTLALSLAKKLKKSPTIIANEIAPHIQLNIIDKTEVTPSGYINFFFKKPFLIQCLKDSIQNAYLYLSTNIGFGKKVMVEFVSANPTGPITVANARSGPIGDTIANLYELNGYQVDREFYVNDRGAKVAKLTDSVLYQYKKMLNVSAEMPVEFYPGSYISDIAKELVSEKKDTVLSWEETVQKKEIADFALNKMLQKASQDLGEMNIKFDTWFRENTLHNGFLKETIDQLRSKGFVYDAEGATWFRSTAYGDDKDRVLLRSDGSPTYLAGDIAYHRNKFERGYDILVDIWGADQSHIKPLRCALEILGFDPEKLKIVVFQLVHLYRGNEELKMSKSSGDFISLRELIEEIGPDVTRFIFLTRNNEQHLNFDMDIAQSKDPKNPVFYAQYAYTRCKGILREAENLKIPYKEKADLSLLTDPSEMIVLRKIALLPDLIFKAFENNAPNLITSSILELVNDFHAFYENCHVLLPDNPELSKARLNLVFGIQSLLLTLFKFVGIHAPERM